MGAPIHMGLSEFQSFLESTGLISPEDEKKRSEFWSTANAQRAERVKREKLEREQRNWSPQDEEMPRQ